MSSAICFNLDQSKILLSGNGLSGSCYLPLSHPRLRLNHLQNGPAQWCTHRQNALPDCDEFSHPSAWPSLKLHSLENKIKSRSARQKRR